MSEPILNIGIISFAHVHTDGYARVIGSLPNARLAGITDADADRGRAKAAEYGVPFVESIEALLAAPSLDAVVVTSETTFHRSIVEAAARAGKHVLCEKPLATNRADAEAMIRACAEANVQLMTAFPCRFHPTIIRLKGIVESGQAGRILGIRGTNCGSNPGGWFCKPDLSGGGAIMDHTVHVADLMRWLLKDEAVEVYAEISNGIEHKDFDDVAFISLKFGNGAFGTLDTSWSRPRSYPTWGGVVLEVVTEHGVIAVDMFSQNLVRYSGDSEQIRWMNWGGDMDGAMIGGFASAILDGREVPVTGEDGLKATSIAFAAYKSAAEGGPVNPANA